MTMQKWGIIASFLTALVVAMPLAAEPAMKVIEETLHVQGPIKGLKLGLRHASLTTPATQHPRSVVLILHGAGVPVSGNPDFPLAGHSLMTALAEKGLDVWALDYYGFGESDRYPEMSQSADSHAPLGRAEECADQVDAVMDFLKRDRHIDRIMLIGDSGGGVNVPKIKGIHQAIRSGMLAAEHLAEKGAPQGFDARWRASPGGQIGRAHV